jgi:hypothetical protein
MKRTTVFAAGVLFIFAGAINAQKMLLNAAYLNEFPTIERVRAETKGSDAVDSYARYMAALDVINQFLINDLLRAPNGGYYNMPPAADKVHYRYSNEITRLSIDAPEPPAKDPRYRPLRDKYEADPAFVDMLLQKMFSVKFRAEYYAWTRRPMPATTAVKSGGPSAGNGGGNGVGSSAGGGDQSVAKAKAAGVDLSLFAGVIKMGGSLNLAACPYRNNFLGIPERVPDPPDCLDIPQVPAEALEMAEMINKIVGVNTKPSAPDTDAHSVYLSEDHRPSWMSGINVAVRTFQGGVVRVVIMTQSKDVSKRVETELTAKYGRNFIVHSGTITPDTGNKFEVRNLEWSLPGLHVEYQVLEVDENDRVHTNGQGYVRIETDVAYKDRIAKENKPAKRVL